jgi:hypothetical protein
LFKKNHMLFVQGVIDDGVDTERTGQLCDAAVKNLPAFGLFGHFFDHLVPVV